MSQNSVPRRSVEQPFTGFPAYGAVHDVVPNGQLRDFLLNAALIADNVFGADYLVSEAPLTGYEVSEPARDAATIEVTSPQLGEYDPRRYYRIFDTDTLGVSVVGMDESARATRTIRAIWEKQDLGAVEQEARDQIGRSLVTESPRLFFNDVRSVGRRMPGVARTEVRQKIALIPDDHFPETTNLIEEEADIIFGAINRRLKRHGQFFQDWETLPTLPFEAFRKDAQPQQVTAIVNATRDHIKENPFGIRLGDLTFRHRLERGRGRNR